MNFELIDDSVVFTLPHPKRAAPARVTFTLNKSMINNAQWAQIFSVITDLNFGTRLTTQRTRLSVSVRPLIEYFSHSEKEFPKSFDDWNYFLVDFFQFYLTDETWSCASLASRLAGWQTVMKSVFSACINRGLIPEHVPIPHSGKRRFITKESSNIVLAEEEISQAPQDIQSQKLLVNVDFAENDADYLEKFEVKCKLVISTLRDVCMSHWDALIKDAHTGKRISEKISRDDIRAHIENNSYTFRLRGGRLTPLASNKYPDGHVWGIALIRLSIEMGQHPDFASVQTIRRSPFFPDKSFKSSVVRYSELDALTSMDKAIFRRLHLKAQFARFVGVLSPLDVAAVSCILIMEHPQLTPHSLSNARLINRRNKTFLLLTDTTGKPIMSVDKPRAGTRKAFVLTETSARLLDDINSMTREVRALLRRFGHKAWKYLFLGASPLNTLKPIGETTSFLALEGASLVNLYPKLGDVGLKYGTFDYRKLRTTLGILKWFETGSIIEMSRTLGNSGRVALEHYIPPELLKAWNTRLVRRFQNLIIILAAHDEPDLVELTDFTKISDLQKYVSQLMLEFPKNSSPISDAIHKRFSNEGPSKTAQFSLDFDSVLNIRVSDISLAHLYAFSEFAVNNLSDAEINKVDPSSSLSPAQFISLSQLLQHACEDKNISSRIRELVNVPLLKSVHENAMVRKEIILKTYKSVDLSSTLADA